MQKSIQVLRRSYRAFNPCLMAPATKYTPMAAYMRPSSFSMRSFSTKDDDKDEPLDPFKQAAKRTDSLGKGSFD